MAKPRHATSALTSAFVKVQNLDRDLVEVPRIRVCRTFATRLRGLMFRRQLARNEGLLLVGSRDQRMDAAIHMLFVPFDLAVIWINGRLEVADKAMAKAWHAAYIPSRPARYVLELHPDLLAAFDVGHNVSFVDD